jgi:ATP-dependent protease Clp ATPase subunit
MVPYLIFSIAGFGMQTNSSQGRRAAAQSALNEGHGSDDEQDQRERDRYLSDVEAFDLIEFGMIPEFVGRFPALVRTHHMFSRILNCFFEKTRSPFDQNKSYNGINNLF